MVSDKSDCNINFEAQYVLWTGTATGLSEKW